MLRLFSGLQQQRSWWTTCRSEGGRLLNSIPKTAAQLASCAQSPSFSSTPSSVAAALLCLLACLRATRWGKAHLPSYTPSCCMCCCYTAISWGWVASSATPPAATHQVRVGAPVLGRRCSVAAAPQPIGLCCCTASLPDISAVFSQNMLPSWQPCKAFQSGHKARQKS